MAKVLPQIGDKFKGAVQKTDQEQRITDLQAEVERLRASQSPELETEIAKLREQLQTQTGEIAIDTGLIDPNPNQPRQTITQESIQAKARLLKKHGQITPVILVPQDNGRYMLLDGQLRWSGAKLLGWETIRALIVPQPQDLDQSSLLTFLGFEDLNPLDKAEAIFKEITKSTGLEVDEVATTLAAVLKRLERNNQVKQLTKLLIASSEEQQQGLEVLDINNEEQALFLVFLEFGLNPASVKSNLLPMLSLPEDLKKAIRHQELKGAHALALATLSSKILKISEQEAAIERIKATEQVLNESLTVPETRDLIKNIKAKYLTSEQSESKEVKVIIQKISSGLSEITLANASREQLQSLQEILSQKLNEIGKLIG
ncbi:chromosome partitioning protein ParB [Nostoc calcicola FACHB-389]|nr:ParB/RepB/Spo0J family partition protein [Nostoc calcicola FACHB-3891]OKH16048.1 chromosome partitioning protein ParB [Nostoc calcicola FACHB-389]